MKHNQNQNQECNSHFRPYDRGTFGGRASSLGYTKQTFNPDGVIRSVAERRFRMTTNDYKCVIAIEITVPNRVLGQINESRPGAKARLKRRGFLLDAVLELLFCVIRDVAIRSFGMCDPMEQLNNLRGVPPMDESCGFTVIMFRDGQGMPLPKKRWKARNMIIEPLYIDVPDAPPAHDGEQS